LQGFAIEAKTAAFVVVSQCVVVAVDAEQNLMRTDLKVFWRTLKLRAT
jgi:imidazole glycerol phosphate synthase subunit HisF